METRSGIFFIDHQRSGFGSHVCPQVPGTGSDRLVATGTYACCRSATTDPENLVLTSAAIRVKSVGSVKNVEYVKSAVGSARISSFAGVTNRYPRSDSTDQCGCLGISTRFYHQGILPQDTRRSGSPFYRGRYASRTPADPPPTYIAMGMLWRSRGNQCGMGLLQAVASRVDSRGFPSLIISVMLMLLWFFCSSFPCS